MSSKWKPWDECPSGWLIRETELIGAWLSEFNRPPGYHGTKRYDVYVTKDKWDGSNRREYLERGGHITDPLMALALVHYCKEKYGERSEDGGVRGAGAEA